MKDQFKLLCQLLYDVNDNIFEELYSKSGAEVELIINDFNSDIEESKSGYPTKKAQETPFTEEAIHSLIGKNFTPKKNVPFICLSHDVDYIYPTFVQAVKRVLGRRDFNIALNRNAYLDSLEKYLILDKLYGKSTLFAALPKAGRQSLKDRFKQWLIDPSYTTEDQEFGKFVELLHKYDVDLGIHGSYFSLKDEHFKEEVKALSKATRKSINLSRQHWLHFNKVTDFTKMTSAGIKIDSTLGWNGSLGFRCGMARPYPILLPNNEIIWEMPMLLMDGVLFDELNMNEDEVVSKSIEILEIVYNLGGGTSLNWHERTYAKDYKWGNAYKRILEYAKKRGFIFLSFSEAVKLYE